MNEEWRPIKDFPGYQVSSLGRVQSFRRGDIFGKILSPRSCNKYGRRLVTIYRDAKRCDRLVARLVCQAFHGDPPTPAHHAAHVNETCDDDRSENIEWQTPQQNIATRIPSRGENHYAAKTTEAIVRQIRQMHAEKKHLNRHYGAIPALAKQFGLTPSAVEDIVNRRKWRHI